MAESKNKSGNTVAVVGGGALLLLLLLRGKGWGLGASGDGRAPGDAAPTAAAPTPTPGRCRVRVDKTGIQLDGTPTDVAATVDGCRPAGAADVLITGEAISGVVDRLLQAFRDAGIVATVSTPYTAAGAAQGQP